MESVLKFGGTSVGSAENIKKVAKIITSRNSRITVLSAMSGTTDGLIKITNSYSNSDFEAAKEQIALLRDKYQTCVELLLGKNDEAQECLDRHFGVIEQSRDADQIVAQGELMTTAIFTLYLKSIGHKAVLLNAPDFVTMTSEGNPIVEKIDEELARLVTDKETFYVTQGFIATTSEGKIGNLGRGGSDYSAALFGAAIKADQVEIWTDIDGMHNNDPRFVDKTYPIRKMTFGQAAELAYFGAKILHPATILPCKRLSIPVLLKNTMAPDAEGTLITSNIDEIVDYQAVAAKDNITIIRITSSRMLMAYGFLRKVFEVFEKYKTPIDMIATSEVAVSITIDCHSHLDEILKELEGFGIIEVEENNTIICVVGNFGYGQHGVVAKVLDAIHEEVPVKMISYGASNLSVAFLVAHEDKKHSLQLLNDKLFMQ